LTENQEAQYLRRVVALLRITLGIIILATWYDNLNKGIYTAEGITGLFSYIFNENGGGPAFYRALIEGSILQAPGVFATFQMAAEFLMGLALLIGFLTPVAGAGAILFFFNLFLAYWGGDEWIWVYVLLTISALVVTLSRSGRAFGIDQVLLAKREQPPLGIFW
jgi:uncharacterized membrane protein YphA (DoxX/SURF4 family)